MALAFVYLPPNPDSASAIGNTGSLRVTLTSITLDASYAAGGIPLTPQQLGHNTGVQFGIVSVRTAVAVASPSGGVLDCTTPATPKLKLVAAGSLAELANAAGSGAVVDVLSWGY